MTRSAGGRTSRVARLLVWSLLLTAASARTAFGQGLTIGGYTLVREGRVTPVLSDFEYRAVLTNGTAAPLAGATAALVSSSPLVTVLDGTLTFGHVGSAAATLSVDTFTIRRPRLLPLVPTDLAWTVTPGPRPTGPLSIRNYTLVAQRHVSATQSDFDYRAVLTNGGSTPLTGATAAVTSQLPAMKVVDGTLTFGPVPAGGAATSADTFTIRRLRLLPLLPGAFVWTVVPTQGANRGPNAVIAPVTAPPFVGQTVRLDATASSDPDGAALAFTWTLTSRPAGSTAALQNPATATPSLRFDRPGQYRLRLVVSDGLLSDEETLVVTTANSAPVAAAGSSQTARVGSPVTLDGSGSFDVDGDALTYAWTVDSRPAGSTAALSDPAAVRPTVTIDAPGTFTFRLVVTDTHDVPSAPSLVAVSTENSVPAANAGPDQTVARGSTVQLNGAGSTDADGDALTYVWDLIQVPSGSAAVLANGSSVNPTFVADRRGDFVVRLTVGDPSRTSSADTVTITTQNAVPQANAGPDQSVAVGGAVELDGSGSTDVDGDSLTYAWSFTSRPVQSRAALSDAAAVRPAFTVDVPGLFTLQLMVSDNAGGSSIDTVVISTANSRPIAAAGPDGVVVVGRQVTLDAGASRDADGDPLTYSWALTTKPANSAAALSDAGAVRPAFVADLPGTYVAQLTVSDGTLSSAPDTVTVSTSNATPVADAGADPPRVALGATVTLDGRGSTDADGHPLRYSWSILVRPPESVAALDDASSATPSIALDRGGDYVFQLIVSDGFLTSGPDTVLVRVNRPPVADAGPDRSQAAGTTVALTGSGSSDPDGDALSFSWRLVPPAGSAAVLANPNSVTPSFTPDTAGQYEAHLIVRDGLNDSAPDTIVITAEATRTLSLSPVSPGISTFSQVTLTVSSSPAAPAGGLFINLSSSAAGVIAPLTVSIPEGATSATFEVRSGAESGASTITASAPGTNGAEATITVSLRGMRPSLDSPSVGVDRSVAGTILLTEPAPDAGVAITIASSNAAVALPSPSVVTVAGGGTQAAFSVSGVGAGDALLTASAAGFASATANVAVRYTISLDPAPFVVERGSTRAATVTLSAPAPTGGLTVNLTRDDPTRLGVPATVVVPAAQFSAEVPVSGLLEGSTVIRANFAGAAGAASLEITVMPPSPAGIESSPANGEGDVAVTRETILRFSRALTSVDGITSQTLFAQFGGRILPTRIQIAPDRRTVTLFHLQTLPASARVRVQFNTDGIHDVLGVPLDGDRDGQPGGTATIDFDTLTLTTLPGAAVIGRVFASELGDGGVNTPLAGVVVSVDGLETTLRTTTDAMGNFRLEPAPVGAFFVHIDGRAATNSVPVGAYYPAVGKKWEAKARSVTSIGEVYLPLVVPGTLQPVSRTGDTVVTFPASVLARHPELAGVQIVVPADSLYADNGARGGMVGIAPVAPDRIPSPLPPGLEFPLVITVQTDGASNFDRPVAACFPNLPDRTTGQPLPAGSKSALWSFNHDIGDWEIVGPMTVSIDGTLVCTDAGVGIRQPGWHGTQPGTQLDGTLVPFGCPVSSGALSAKSLSAASASCTTTQAGKILKGVATVWEMLHDALKVLLGALEVIPAAKGANITKLLAGADAAADLAACLENSASCDEQRAAFRAAHGEKVTPALDIVDASNDLLRRSREFKEQLDADPDIPITTFSQGAVRMFEEMGASADIVLVNSRRARDLGAQIADDSDNRSISRSPSAGTMASAALLSATDLSTASREYSLLVRDLAASVALVFERYERLLGQLATDARQFAGGSAIIGERVFILIAAGNQIIRAHEPGGGVQRRAIAPNTLVSVNTYRPGNGAISYWSTVSLSAGSRTAMGQVPEAAVEPGADADNDGLDDFIENITGTDAMNPDTDADGLPDGAEVRQGTNPLDGLAVATGILATANTPGTALDVAARNEVAVVADADRGISVLNVAAGLNPIIVAQVDTPGTAHAVSFEDTLVAVADGPQGLAIVDISDPPAARIARQLGSAVLGGGATAVVVAGGTAYVGLDTNVVAVVDIATGSVLETVGLPAGVGALQDVAIERDTLYVLTVGQLHAIPLQSPLQVSGSVASPGSIGAGVRRLRLFAGGGVAYATFTGGYNTFSLAAPQSPSLLAAGSTAQAGWKQIVANGSGLGFAAVGPNSTDDGPHNVSLYDVSDPTQTDRFITEFETPGLAAAVAIYNGIGYVADSDAGLQVVNYLAFDRNGVPPAIALESNFPLSATTGTAEEGHVMRVTADVSDDVQVRSVEFFVNGASVAQDGNFPFEHRFVTPVLGAAPSFTLRACASDTGGNRTCTEDIPIQLVEDATPPRVTAVAPRDGSVHQLNSLSSLSATFHETIDVATLTPSTFQLFSAGLDGQVRTPDDVLVSDGALTYNAQSATAVMSFASPLPIARYLAVVRRGISDGSGNPMGSDYSWTFSVRAEKRWISDASGSWHDASNWSDNEVPQPGDIVAIDRPGAAPTVTYSSGVLSIAGLQSAEALAITGGILSVEESGRLDGGLTLSGGALAGAGPVTATTFGWTGGQLAGAGSLTIAGASTIPARGSTSITQRTLRLGSTTSWQGAPTGEAFGMSAGASIVNPPGGVWTITTGGDVGASSGLTPRIVNNGTLRVSAGTTILSVAFDNAGEVILEGGTFEMRRGGSSSGSLTGAAGTTFRWETVAPFTFTAPGSVNTAGDLDVPFGSVAFDVPVAANRIIVANGGAPTFTRSVSIAGSLEILEGTATFDTPGTVAMPSLVLRGGTLQGSADFTAGQLRLEGGRLAGGGALTVSGSTSVLGGEVSGRRLQLGATTASGPQAVGELRFTNGATIVNPAGAVWTISTATGYSLGLFQTNGTVTNLGTIRKMGPGLLRAGARFNNAGVADLREGTLLMTGNGSSSGTFLGQPGSTFWWDRSNYTLEPASELNTAGVVDLRVPLSIAGRFSATDLTVQGAGNASFAGVSPSIETLNLNGGTATFGAGTTATVSTVNLAGAINASSDVTIGALNWTSGGFNFDGPATVTVTGPTSFSSTGAGASMGGEGGTVRLGTQTTFVDGARLVMGGGTSLINPVNGVMQFAGALDLRWNIGGSARPTTLFNEGMLSKQGTPGAVIGGSIGLDNSGTIHLNDGTLALNGGMVGNGNLTGQAGTTLRFSSTTRLGAASRVETAGRVELVGDSVFAGAFSAGGVVFAGPTTFSGTVGSLGTSMEIQEGAVSFDGLTPIVVPALTLSGGSLGGTAHLIAPSFDWTQGALRGTGILEVTGATVVGVADPFGKSISQRTLRLGASTLWRDASAFSIEGDATIVNPPGGTFTFDANASLEGVPGVSSRFVNRGVLEFAGPARQVRMFFATFVNEGTLVHRLGGTGAGQFDRLAVDGSALGGTLDVRLIDAFTPASGDAFNLLTYSSRSGQFSTLQGNGEIYTVTFGPSLLTLAKP